MEPERAGLGPFDGLLREASSTISTLLIGVVNTFPPLPSPEKHSGSWSIIIPDLFLHPRNASSSIEVGHIVLLPPSSNVGSELMSVGLNQGDCDSSLLHEPILNDSSHICPSWGAFLSYVHGSTIPSSSTHSVPLGDPAMISLSSALVAATYRSLLASAFFLALWRSVA